MTPVAPCQVIVVICFLAVLFPLATAAEVISANHRYQLGDNDSANDGRRYCLNEVKKKIAERLGVQVESTTEVRNLQLYRSEIRSRSGAIIQLNVHRDEIKQENGSLVAYCAASADADKAVLAPPPSSYVAAAVPPDRTESRSNWFFASEADAKAQCPRQPVVWFNTQSHVYHFPGQRWYGRTKNGGYACKSAADEHGGRPSGNGQ